jgi:hypothetical protein
MSASGAFLQAERQLLESYLRRTSTPQFLKVAEILLQKHWNESALWVLKQGIAEFPMLSSARLLYARKTFEFGYLQNAIDAAQQLKASQPNNISLLKLELRIAIYAEQLDVLKTALKDLSLYVPDDELMKKCRVTLATEDWAVSKLALFQEIPLLGGISPEHAQTTQLPGSFAEVIQVLKDELNKVERTPTNVAIPKLNRFVEVPTYTAIRMPPPEPFEVQFLRRLLAGLEAIA